MIDKFACPSDLVKWSFDQDLGDASDNHVLRSYYGSFIQSFGPLRRQKYDLQLEQLTALVRSGEVRSILDVGCGCGSVSLWLAQEGADVTGIDITTERLRVARRRAELMGLPAKFQQANILEMTGTYDAIWIEQAYHHLEPRRDVQAKIGSLLNPGGRLIISETNAWNPLVQAQLFRRRGFKTVREHVGDDGRVHVYGDERITTPGALTQGFDKHGVKTLGTKYYGVLPNHPVMEKFEVVEKLTPPFMIPAFTHYLWVGQKA